MRIIRADSYNIYTEGSMKSKLFLSLVGAFCLGAAMGSHAQAPSAGTEKAVTALENQWPESEATIILIYYRAVRR